MHYKMTGVARKEIVGDVIDIKNKVLEDKRKSMIQILKDKRPKMSRERVNDVSQTMLNNRLPQNIKQGGNVSRAAKISGYQTLNQSQ